MADAGIQPAGNADGHEGGTAKTVYFLYLGGILFWPLSVVGVIMAFVNRGGAVEWLASHYRFQIQTFWLGLPIVAVGVATALFVVGYFVLLAGLIWWIVLGVKGLKYLSKSEPYPKATTWLW